MQSLFYDMAAANVMGQLLFMSCTEVSQHFLSSKCVRGSKMLYVQYEVRNFSFLFHFFSFLFHFFSFKIFHFKDKMVNHGKWEMAGGCV